MVYAVLLSALAGCLLTVLVQCLVVYRWRRSERPLRRAPPAPPPPPGRAVRPDGSLRDYLRAAAGSGAGAGGGGPPGAAPPESCHFLNAIFLFLFRELRDSALLRRWLAKKIRVEFEELLRSRTAGRLLEGLSLRDISLGDSLPVFRSVRPLPGGGGGAGGTEQPAPPHPPEQHPPPGSEPPPPPPGPGPGILPEELSFELELEYNGGFHLAIDVDLVFGKSAYLFVKLSRVLGRLRLHFSRLPFSHWAFCFLDEPLIDFEVQSEFEGRPMPQLTSIIVNQLKKVIKRKHTLPHYKIRYDYNHCGGGGDYNHCGGTITTTGGGDYNHCHHHPAALQDQVLL
ncbi:PDZ domain-containing 8 [Pelobates cultripes]|uniref:PDZ domain-containing 8 n=1 Tax=Pelobates cultripes TaxID=61616 RepID=A0AAD1WPW9_PELCU|nr:PDZ domain-containing 8 [Pelobates cultripes]